MKLTNIVLVAAGLVLSVPTFAVANHGPYNAHNGLQPGGFPTPGTQPQTATREPGANGQIARDAEKGNPTEDGVNEVIEGLFPGQADGLFPRGRDGAR